jgi:hypothetical protein
VSGIAVVSVTVSVRIDREVWDANYGTGTGDAEVRADVKAYVENLVTEQLREVGVLAETS